MKQIAKRRILALILSIAIACIYNTSVYSEELIGQQIPVAVDEVEALSIDNNDNSSQVISEETTDNEDLIVTAGIVAELNDILNQSTTSAELSSELLTQSNNYDDTCEQPVEETQDEQTIEINYIDSHTMYVGSDWLRLRSTPDNSVDDNIIKTLHPGSTVNVIGEVNDSIWVLVNYNEQEGFLSSEYIQETSPEEATYNYNWYGEKLNSSNGKVAGPSGNETYYNLDMSRVIYYMNLKGYYYDYWVRSDGVKMFGNYVMVAANLSTRPKGTLVETTLGTGIVVDTGEFVNYDPNRLDVAVTWV